MPPENKAKDFSLDLDGETYLVRFNLTALANAEKEVGKDPFSEGEIGVSGVLSLLYHGLQYHHEDLTREDVGNLVGAWNIERVSDQLMEAAEQISPDGEGEGEGNG